MSSTHSANPLCCAASHASFKYILENNLIDNSRELGGFMLAELNRMKEIYPNISYISGKGLLAAVHFGKYPLDADGAVIANKVVDECLSNGLITVRTGRETIKLGPPLTITKDGMLDALRIFENAIKKSV